MNSLEERKRNNTMRTLLGAIFLCTLLLATSCSVRRFLPAGERLYSGSTIKVEKDSATSGSKKSLQKTLKLAVTPKANKFLLGQPYKVWWWYKIGEPKKEKGLKAFLRKKLGEPPVLSSRVNAKVQKICNP
jgi:outer membrane protein insertion porin family